MVCRFSGRSSIYVAVLISASPSVPEALFVLPALYYNLARYGSLIGIAALDELLPLSYAFLTVSGVV